MVPQSKAFGRFFDDEKVDDCKDYVEKYDKKHGHGKGEARLIELLLYHIVNDILFTGDLEDGDKIKTLEGSKVEISRIGKLIFVDYAEIRLSKSDMIATNGILHGIRDVLHPYH